MPRPWWRLPGDERGAAAPLVALCFMTLIGAAAVSVDLSRVFLASRRLQGLADLAAMSAVQAMGGQTDDAASASAAAGAAGATVAANPWSPGAVATKVEPGVYTPDPTQPSAQRFVAGPVAPSAARVTLSATVPLIFASIVTGRPSLQVTRSAIAGEAQLAAFSVGSGLASVDGGVANALLSAMAGGQVSLSAMDYQALLSARVDMMGYMSALATRLSLTGASFDNLMAAQISAPVALSALADALTAENSSQAAAAASRLAAAAGTDGPVSLSNLFDLGPYGDQDHGATAGGAAVSLQALSLADALLEAAGGQRQVGLDLGAAAPGLLDVKVSLAIGQRPSHSPWLTITQSRNVIVSTAQTRLYLQATAPPAAAAALGASVLDLSAYAEAASAQARLTSLSCPSDPQSQNVTLSAEPSLGSLAIGQVNPTVLSDFSTPVAVQPATVANLGVVQAIVSAQVSLSGGWTTVAFDQADIVSHAVKSVYASNIAQASLGSLIGGATVKLQPPVGPPIGAGLAGPVLQGALQPAAVALDGVLAELEALTGAHLGEADVWIDGLRCRGAALVG